MNEAVQKSEKMNTDESQRLKRSVWVRRETHMTNLDLKLSVGKYLNLGLEQEISSWR